LEPAEKFGCAVLIPVFLCSWLLLAPEALGLLLALGELDFVPALKLVEEFGCIFGGVVFF
jgi:hypothetical protein